mmetsp:Transcript_35465/g.77631  ORF Transcript_35465/g.77631 Transcript_35465/m.77631 type:complete len:292 (-) Transcript_35465:1257-2132(-)
MPPLTRQFLLQLREPQLQRRYFAAVRCKLLCQTSGAAGDSCRTSGGLLHRLGRWASSGLCQTSGAAGDSCRTSVGLLHRLGRWASSGLSDLVLGPLDGFTQIAALLFEFFCHRALCFQALLRPQQLLVLLMLAKAVLVDACVELPTRLRQAAIMLIHAGRSLFSDCCSVLLLLPKLLLGLVEHGLALAHTPSPRLLEFVELEKLLGELREKRRAVEATGAEPLGYLRRQSVTAHGTLLLHAPMSEELSATDVLPRRLKGHLHMVRRPGSLPGAVAMAVAHRRNWRRLLRPC